MWLIEWLVSIALLCSVLVIGGRVIFPLPSLKNRRRDQAIPPSPDTQLARLLAQGAEASPDKSGVLPLAAGKDAIGTRLFLAGMAEHSIDAQYYIWKDDTSGRLLLKALHAASQRGVRVRLLLDDNGVSGFDSTMAALDGLPNFEIRLFNPSTIRRPKLAGFAIDFMRLNRRMHNKAFIVDGVTAIVGGRNIADEYFDIGEGALFIDLDVLAAGAIVPEISHAFDLYWNSASAYPVRDIVGGPAGPIDTVLANFEEAAQRPEAAGFANPVATGIQRLMRGDSRLEWAAVTLVFDDPAKGLGKARRDQLMVTRLGPLVEPVEQQIDVVSAYFVPGRQGSRFFNRLARQGARVRILTNAMETTDVALVHSGYVRYRRKLLAGGVKLFEMKPVRGAPRGDTRRSIAGSSGASLHAKTLAADDRRAFVGSFNFDPRSVLLNCEMGLLIESPTLARGIRRSLDDELVSTAYEAVLDGRRLIWIERHPDGTETRHTVEPGTTWLGRLAVRALGRLPIEWLL